MRILLVIDTLAVGGAERHTVNLAIALQDRGHIVAVACTVGGEFEAELNAAGIPVHQILAKPVKRRVSIIFGWRLRRVLKRLRADVVHAHCFASMAAAALATWRTGVPLVLTEHSEAVWQTPLSRWTTRRLHRRAQGSIAVSAAIAARFAPIKEKGGGMIVIHNALPTQDEAQEFSGTICAGKDRLIAGPNPPVVGTIARLRREKAVHIFLEALALLPEVQGVILGDGPERSSLATDVHRLGLETRVRFLPAITRPAELLHRLDALVVPSLTEGSPLVVLEAMTAGVPVVATRVGGIPEMIVHGLHGILVPPNDSVALAAGITSLLADTALPGQFATAAQGRVRSHFRFADMIGATEQVYRQAVERAGARIEG